MGLTKYPLIYMIHVLSYFTIQINVCDMYLFHKVAQIRSVPLCTIQICTYKFVLEIGANYFIPEQILMVLRTLFSTLDDIL